MDTCHALNAKGEPCGSPPEVVEDGYCPAHRDDDPDHMSGIGRKGAESTARKLQRPPPELEDDLGPVPPPPENVEDIKRWLSWAMAAVASERIDQKTARQIGYLARALLDTLQKLDVEEELTELREQIQKFRAGDLEAA